MPRSDIKMPLSTLGLTELKEFPAHLQRIFGGHVPKGIVFIESIEKISHRGFSQSRVLVVSEKALIVVNMEEQVRRYHNLANVEKVRWQECIKSGKKAFRVLVKIPKERDFLFLFTAKDTGMKYEEVAQTFFNIIRKLRESQVALTPGVWAGVVKEHCDSDIKEGARLRPPPNYIDPSEKIKRWDEQRSNPSIRSSSPFPSPLQVASTSPQLKGTNHPRESLGDSQLSRDGADSSFDDMSPSPSGRRSPSAMEVKENRIVELEQEVAKLKEDCQRGESDLFNLEQHLDAFRTTNQWMEEQMQEKNGVIEDLEARNADLEREVTSLKGEEGSPTNSDGKSRKVSFVEESNKNSEDISGKDGVQVNSSKVLQDEIGLLNMTVEELQKGRQSDETRVRELSELVNRILQEKNAVLEENTQLRQRVESMRLQEELLAEAKPTPRVPRASCTIALQCGSALCELQSSSAQTVPLSNELKLRLPTNTPIAIPIPAQPQHSHLTAENPDFVLTATSVDTSSSCSSEKSVSPQPDPQNIQRSSEPEAPSSEPEMLRLKAACDALLLPGSPPTTLTPPKISTTKSMSLTPPSANHQTTSPRMLSPRVESCFSQTESHLTLSAETQTELGASSAQKPKPVLMGHAFSSTVVADGSDQNSNAQSSEANDQSGKQRPQPRPQNGKSQPLLSSSLLKMLCKNDLSKDDELLSVNRSRSTTTASASAKHSAIADKGKETHTIPRMLEPEGVSPSSALLDATYELSITRPALRGASSEATPQSHEPSECSDRHHEESPPHHAADEPVAESVVNASPTKTASSVTYCGFHNAVQTSSPIVIARSSSSNYYPRSTSTDSFMSGRSCPDEQFIAKLCDIGMTNEEVERLVSLSIRKKEHLLYVTYEELTRPPCSLPAPLVRRLLTAFGYAYLLPNSSQQSPRGKSPSPEVVKSLAKLQLLSQSIIDGTFEA